jgi:hypothetical protein
MGLYSIELTPADTMDQQSVFQQEMADLLGCRQLTILPPFPDYSLLSQNHSPKALLKVVNEVILSRRPAYEKELGWHGKKEVGEMGKLHCGGERC